MTTQRLVGDPVPLGDRRSGRVPVQPANAALDYRRQARARGLRKALLDAVSVLMVVVPVAIFLAQGNAALFTSLAGGLLGLGMLSGLVATALLCQMLLLAARIPFVDDTLGQDRALIRHRKLNTSMISLLIMHALLLLAGYAAQAGTNVVTEFLGLWPVRDFVLAVASMALFAVVGLSSAAAARARLSHEVWWVIHLVSYLAVLVSIPHQFSLGGMFAQGAARWYWAAMFLVAFFCLLCFRVFLPIFNSLDHRLTVTTVEPAGRDAVSISLRGEHMGQLGLRAGQYFGFRFLAPGLWWHEHPFSTSSTVRDDGSFRITVQAAGAGTRALMRVRPGTPVLVEGPYGMFSDRARTREAVVLLGAGSGIGPIRALLESTGIVPGRAMVVLRAAHPGGLYLYDEIRALCQARGVRLVTMVGHRARSRGAAAWTSADHAGTHLADLAPWVRDADVYVCGPDGFMDAVLVDARMAGVPGKQLHHERFSW